MKFKVQRSRGVLRTLLFIIYAVLVSASPVRAEVKTIDAEYAYAPGDNGSLVDARRIATQEAQRKALEQAGAFVASLAQVKEYRLTRDEVIAYTAGIVTPDVVSGEDRGTAQHPEVLVRVRCRIDTGALVGQIDRYQDSEELREQLEDMAQQQDALRKERDGLVKQLQAEKDKTKAAETQQKLGAVLTREESIDATRRVWAAVSPQIDFYGSSDMSRPVRPEELEDAANKLKQVVQANPDSQQAGLLLAIIYEEQDDLDRAETLLRETIARHPDLPILHLRLGIVLRREKQYDEALRELHVMEKKRPNQPQMLFQTGLTHKAKGNCRLASAYMKRLLLYTRKVVRPDIEKLKPRAREVIESCGEQLPKIL